LIQKCFINIHMDFDLQKNIEENIIRDFRYKISEVLSFCESPIEKKLLLHIFNYFFCYKEYNWDKFQNIVFIEDMLFPYDKNFYETEEEKQKILSYIKKNQYRFDYGCFAKYNSFKTRVNYYENNKLRKKRPIIKNTDKKGSIRQEYIVQPQYETFVDGNSYRLDIAIILNRSIDDEIVDTAKIGLECDGYDYHSSPSQKRNDDIRTRKLKLNGWDEIFRYSGSEINNLKTSDFNNLFSEIENMFYRK
jgi:hypothetical protein